MELAIIHQKIYEIRGHRVMMDYDLAELYGTETKYLKRSVRNNIKRFPADFMFEVSKDEWETLRCKICTLEIGRGKSPKYLPFAFTEQGVAMLSSVLNSDKAIEVNIEIMRAFVTIKQEALTNKELTIILRQLEEQFNRQFDDVHEVLNYLIQKDNHQKKIAERNRIGYK